MVIRLFIDARAHRLQSLGNEDRSEEAEQTPQAEARAKGDLNVCRVRFFYGLLKIGFATGVACRAALCFVDQAIRTWRTSSNVA